MPTALRSSVGDCDISASLCQFIIDISALLTATSPLVLLDEFVD